MPPRLIIQIWDNDKFSLDDYLGRASIWIFFSTNLCLEFVKWIKAWNQVFKSPVLQGSGGGAHLCPECPLGTVAASSAVSGPLSRGHSECHPFLWAQRPRGGSCTSFCLAVKTQILFSQKDATPLPALLPNHPLSLSPQHLLQAALKLCWGL